MIYIERLVTYIHQKVFILGDFLHTVYALAAFRPSSDEQGLMGVLSTILPPTVTTKNSIVYINNLD